MIRIFSNTWKCAQRYCCYLLCWKVWKIQPCSSSAHVWNGSFIKENNNMLRRLNGLLIFVLYFVAEIMESECLRLMSGRLLPTSATHFGDLRNSMSKEIAVFLAANPLNWFEHIIEFDGSKWHAEEARKRPFCCGHVGRDFHHILHQSRKRLAGKMCW